MLSTFQQSILELFLFMTMAGIGLQVEWRDFVAVTAHKRILILSLVVNFLVIPLFGWAITKFVALTPLGTQALIILACAPGGLSTVQFTSKSKDAQIFAGQVAVLLSCLSIFASPILMALLLPQNIHLIVPYGKAVAYVSVFLLLPLVIGMAVRNASARTAQTLARPIAFIGTGSFVLLILLTLSFRRSVMAEFSRPETLSILLFILATMLIGWLSGGPRRETRQVSAAASSMRNVALAFAVASRSLPGTGIEIPLAAFFALMVTPNMVLVFVLLGIRKFARPKAPQFLNPG